MKKIMWGLMLFLLACNLFIAGCQFQRNAETGKLEWRVEPKVVNDIEASLEGGIGILDILAPLLGPVGGILTGTAATALALVKKYKPTITSYKSKAEMSHAVATVSVDAIELIKDNHPEVWKEVEDTVRKFIVDHDLPTAEIKNAIRGLRGLPAKTDIRKL